MDMRLASGLFRLLGDEALRLRMGTNARRLAVERFSLEAMGEALRKLYEDLRLASGVHAK